MAEIRVTGAATRKVAADEASVSASGRFSGPERTAIVAAAAELQERVVERMRAAISGGAAEQYVADAIRTSSSSWQREDGERVVEHTASVSVSLRLTDPSRAEQLVAELIDAGADVDAVWRLSTQRRAEVTRELRSEALADALSTAHHYARELGASGAEVVRLDDGADDRGVGAPFGAGAMRAAKAFDAAPPEVTVQDVEVSARVLLRCETARS